MNQKSHDYARLADVFAELEIENTYYLAFRDLPDLIDEFVGGKAALDHGCGAGRSSRFLKNLGFSVIGVNVSPDMIQAARGKDPGGIYQTVEGTQLPFKDSSFDLVLQAIVVMEFPSQTTMNAAFFEISRVLKDSGVAIVITHNAEQCVGEWASFIWKTNKDKRPKSGEQAEVLVRGTEITFNDYMWYHPDLEDAFKQAGLIVRKRHQPVATGQEPYKWYQELLYPYWDVYVLSKT